MNTGGPAFPTSPVHHGYTEDTHSPGTGSGPGMDLLDYFAARALPSVVGLISLEVQVLGDNTTDLSPGGLAKKAYHLARAMLAEKDRLAQRAKEEFEAAQRRTADLDAGIRARIDAAYAPRTT